MKQKSIFSILLKSVVILTLTLGLITACGGGSGVSFENPTESGGATTDCDDTGDTVTSTSVTATQSGTTCSTPTPSTPSSGVILLDCSQPENRTTTSTTTDITTVTCGSGDGAATNTYHCSSGIVVQNDGSESGVTLFDQVQVTCTVNDSDEATLAEEELVVS